MGLVAAIVATTVAAGAAVARGRQEQLASDKQARFQEKQANQVLRAAQERVDLAQERAGRLRAAQSARFGAAGVTGILPQVVDFESSVRQAEEDARILEGARTEAGALRERARNIRGAGTAAFRSGLVSAGITQLVGATRILGQIASADTSGPSTNEGQEPQIFDFAGSAFG